MQVACLQGDLTRVQELLQEDQDPTVKDEKNITPLMLAATNSTEIVRLLLQNLLVKEHINDCDNVNWSALHYACRFNQPEIVKLLLEEGIEPLIQATDGVDSTALDIAYRYRHVKCVHVLNEWKWRYKKNFV